MNLKNVLVEINCQPYNVDIEDGELVSHFCQGPEGECYTGIKKLTSGYLCEKCKMVFPKAANIIAMLELRRIIGKLIREDYDNIGAACVKTIYYSE